MPQHPPRGYEQSGEAKFCWALRGAKKAIIALTASMLTAAWHMLRNGTEFRDLGTAHFDCADAHKTATRLIRRLRQIGGAVLLTSVA